MKQQIIEIIRSFDPVPEEKGGFLIDQSDIEAMAEAIDKAIGDAALTNIVGE